MIKSIFFTIFFSVSIINVTKAQNNNLSEGAAVLFNNVTTKLTNIEKNEFYDSLKITLNDDNTFTHTSTKLKFKPSVTPVDLNHDGQEDFFLTINFDLTTGLPILQELFIKNGSEGYKVWLNTNGKLPYVFLNNYTSNYPDLTFVDDNGIQSVYKKNPAKKQYSIYNGEKRDTTKCISISEMNRKYTSELIKNNSANINRLPHLENSNQKSVTTLTANNSSEINELANCQKLINTGKTQAEKDELQKDYWTLLGIVSDLDNYRQMFLQEGKLINLFPTAYYHTTYAEIQNLLKLQFKYPIETMKQMIAFYDAYKWNRDNWDKGNKNFVELHWKQNFEDAESWMSSVNLFCIKVGNVLSAATQAHVVYDLPRAIRYSANNRFNQKITMSQYNVIMHPDFESADVLFANTMFKTISDIRTSHYGCTEGISKWFTSNENGIAILSFLNDLGTTSTLTDVDVIELRHKSWKEAFTGQPLFESSEMPIMPQPLNDHNPLITIGKNLCPPPIPISDLNYMLFKMKPELVTRSKDNNFKWFSWDNAPKEINTAAMDIFVQRDNQPVTTLAHQLDSITGNKLWYAQVGAVDLDNNGVCGVIVKIDRADRSQSSQLLICENGYINTYSVTLSEGQQIFRPSELASKIILNELFTGDKNKTIKLFSYDTTKPAPINVHHLVGGSTPEELGKVLLKALKTNDKNLWANCIHPDIVDEPYGTSTKRQIFIDDFDRVRERLIQEGVTQWSVVEFSRVTYETFDQGIHAVNFGLEFTYKEFNGYIGLPSTEKYNGKYFMVTVVEDMNVERNKGK